MLQKNAIAIFKNVGLFVPQFLKMRSEAERYYLKAGSKNTKMGYK